MDNETQTVYDYDSATPSDATNVVVASTGRDEVISGKDYEENSYVVSSGNVTINNYKAWENIYINSNYQSWTVDGNDFVVNTDDGSVRVTNARGKIMEFVDGDTGNVLMHALMQNAGDEFDGTSYGSDLEPTYGTYNEKVVVVGANDGANVMSAGIGGSELWGGEGKNNDLLVGGEGIDVFIYHVGEGNDVALADEKDVVDLGSVHWEDIRQLKIEDNRALFVFSDYGSLDVMGRAGLFAIDNKLYQADYNGKQMKLVEASNS